MPFDKEEEFESALVKMLTQNGWEPRVLEYLTEEDLLQNWADILFENNRGIDRLNNCPLTQGEMQQILEKIRELRTPLALNGFINGKTTSIVRDNPADTLHFGKEISLKIYDREEIAAGQSRYQIVRQPIFKTSKMLNDRRGDLMLLINGMPVFHIELKKSGIPVSQAYEQIKKYAHEQVYTGLFSLVQIFVAMNPEEMVYFANPGPDGQFVADYNFHWADFNNEPINDWKTIASKFLSIPMAHMMIGYYTVADKTDGILKVMRSYQFYAASAISSKVRKTDWLSGNQRGGYIWHTTGSGKTMTSFKSAQLIANSKDADKVVFLTDRIELGDQSLKNYRNFADAKETVQSTEDTYVLISKLKSTNASDTLIVTSIQKMSNIQTEEGVNERDIELINEKRLVFIVDEAHRSTFGDMMHAIKKTFPGAIFFGFTGTPIQEENQKKLNTTASVFGNELHRYSIADGLRDHNVLGFDPYKVLTFKEKDLRRAVALERAKAKTEKEAIEDKKKAKIYYDCMEKMPMAGYRGDNGKWVKGIEDYASKAGQYTQDEHRRMVVRDIEENWTALSHNGKFHAILATSSIPEAIEYYRLMKKEMPELTVTSLFDPNIDNLGGGIYKEDGLKEVLSDYNQKFQKDFTIPTHAWFKKDVSARLAHKEPYQRIDRDPSQVLNILIVVDQMLTGFDSKWLNTLYLDKVMEYEGIIQAFSRTNRLFGPDKPFGTIRYYRKPYTMEKNIEAAVKLYSGDRPFGLFVDRLHQNIEHMNQKYEEIKDLFQTAGIPDFDHLPDDVATCAKFASVFNEFSLYLDAAKVQGFQWDQLTYTYEDESTGETKDVSISLDEHGYNSLLQRYKDLAKGREKSESGFIEETPYDIHGYLTEIDTGKIDSDYMNSRFVKFLKVLNQPNVSNEEVAKARADLQRTFPLLPKEEQKYANLFLNDLDSGEVTLVPGKTFRDYVTEYRCRAQNERIHWFAERLGLNEKDLLDIMQRNVTEATINAFGRFDKLKATADLKQVKDYLEKKEQKTISKFMVNMKLDALLRDFILKSGDEIDPEMDIHQKKYAESENKDTLIAAENREK